MSRVEFSIILNPTPLSDGVTFPVCLQANFNNTTRRIRLGFRSTLEQWNEQEHRYSGRSSRIKSRNNELDEIETRAYDIYDDHFRNRDFNYKVFAEYFRAKTEGANVLKFLDDLYDDIVKGRRKIAKRKLSIGTAFFYRDVKNAIIKYANDPDTLTFEQIDDHWLEKFEFDCLNGGCTDGGVASYMRGIKAAFGYAIKSKRVEEKYYPFQGKYKMAGYSFSHLNGKKIKDTLTKDEVKKIYHHDPKDEKYELAIDLYCFSFLSFGTNCEDFARFEPHHIKQHDEIKVIEFHRKKTINSTGKLVIVPLIGKSLEIVEKYLKKGGRYIFPILPDDWEGDSEKIKKHIKNFEYSMNKRLQVIAKKEEIEKHVTLYTARHSSGTIADLGGADIKLIAKLFGHSNTAITKNYLRDRFTMSLVEPVKLLDF